MVFAINHEVFDTSNMLGLDIDGVYLSLYLHTGRRMVFKQSLDERRGIMISTVSTDEARTIIGHMSATQLPGAVSFRHAMEEWDRIVGPIPEGAAVAAGGAAMMG